MDIPILKESGAVPAPLSDRLFGPDAVINSQAFGVQFKETVANFRSIQSINSIQH